MRNVVPRGCSGTVMGFSTCDARLRNSAVHVAYWPGAAIYAAYAAGFHNPCGIYSQSSATHAAYTAEVPQSMRYIQQGLRNLYYATIYPTEIYKVPFDIFRLSVELPIQKHGRHKLVSFSIPQSLHYIKRPRGVCRGARPCPPCGFLHFNVDLPAAGGRSLCIYGRDSHPCGHSARASAAHAVIISPYKI